MSVPYALLGLLEDSPRHGYELKQEYDALFSKSRPLKFGQVYATLARLERDGLVEIQTPVPGRGPDRKLYAITSEGVADLDEWLKHPEPAEPNVQSVLFAKVVLALMSNRSAKRYLEKQRAEHQKRMRQLTRMKMDAPDGDELVLDYALYHLQADLDWIEHASARLDRLRQEIRR